MKIIGRAPEQERLTKMLSSNNAEFLVLYGRRRVGKTYLIKNFFKDSPNIVFFKATGLKDGTIKDQISNFSSQIGESFYDGAILQTPKNWKETFQQLAKAIESKDKKVVLFFDEFPWMATPKSGLLQTLDYFWNLHWSNNPSVKLIICGSSASWIINNVISNKGGLHNRVTLKMHLDPFALKDTELFLKSLGINLKESHILKIYMAIGGIPYYLSQVEKGKSAIDVISMLFFDKKSILYKEFDNLFASLFEDAEKYKAIIIALANKPYGMGQRKLLELLGTSETGGGGIKKLKDLEDTGFIMSFKPFGHKRQGIYYRLVDEYCLFFLKWIAPKESSLQKLSLSGEAWQRVAEEPGWRSWLGYSFEIVCYKHLANIREKLKIPPTASAGAWRYVPKAGSSSHGAQIDLLFDRDDDAITICEIKYSEKPYIITKQDVISIENKIKVFRAKTGTKKQIFVALICNNDIQNDYYADSVIDQKVSLVDLFE